jgi:hypothetical protein
MNKLLYQVITLLVLYSWLTGVTVKNPDKPEKGQWEFNPKKVWQLDAIDNDVLFRVEGMKIDQKGNLYIAESKNMKFYVLDPNGKSITSFGTKGQGPGELQYIGRFYLQDNYLISPEMVKIHYFSTKGEFIKDVKTAKWLNSKLFIDENQLIVLSYFPFRVKNNPNYIELYNLKTNTSKKLIELKLKEGFLRYEKGGIRLAIYVNKTVPELFMTSHYKTLLYGNSSQYQIDKIDLTGKKLLSFSIEERKKNPVSKITKRKHVEKNSRITFEYPQNVVDDLLETIPNESPYFYQILVGAKGEIYVLLIDLDNSNQQAVDVFSPEGKYLYHSVINLSNDFEYIRNLAISFVNSELFVFGDNKEDERQLVKYKINLPEFENN